MVRRLATLLPLVFLLGTGTANALGLGELKLNSALNQPLDAEIELLDLQGLTSGEVLPSLAGIEDFRRASVERIFFLSNIQFSISEKNGGLVIDLKTRQPVQEPFLNFLVEVNWPAGRLLREYTVLLDPPVYEDSVILENEVFEPTVVEGSQGSSSQVSEIQSQPEVTFNDTVTEQTRPVRDDSLPEGQYRVQRNDTLWEIAVKFNRDANVTAQQMMLAIQDQNPRAFIQGNINRLKAGSVLTIPSSSSAGDISFNEAVQEVNRQNRALSNPGSSQTEVPISASGDASSALSDGTDLDPEGRLELVSADRESELSASASGDIQEQVESLENDLVIALELNDELSRERDDLQSRVSELEEQIELMQRMINLESETGAALQELDQLQEQENVEAGIGETPEQIESTDPALETENQSGADSFVEPEPVIEEPVVQEPAVVEPVQQEIPAQTQPIVQQPLQPLVEPKPIPMQMLDDALAWINGSIYNLAIVAGGGVLILLIILYLVNKRKATTTFDDDEETVALGAESEDFSDPLEDNELDMSEDLDDLDLGAAEDFEEPVASDEAEATDAVAEADIYIAYGRYDQAEDILKTAIQEDPSRDDYKVKLAEVYAESKNVSGFKTIAAQLAGAGPIAVNRVKELQDSLGMQETEELNSPVEEIPELEEVTTAEPESPSVENLGDDLDFSLDDDLDASVPVLDMEDSSTTTTAETSISDLDFSLDDDLSLGEDLNLDNVESSLETSDLNEGDDGLDFNLEDVDLNLDDNAEVETPELDTSESLDFSLDLDSEDLDSVEEPPQEPLLSTEPEDSGLDFNVEFDSGDIDAGAIANEPTETGSFEVSDLDLELGSDLELPSTSSSEVEDPLAALDAQIEALESSAPELNMAPEAAPETSEIEADLGSMELDIPASPEIETSATDTDLDLSSDIDLSDSDLDLGSSELSEIALEEATADLENAAEDLDLDLGSMDAPNLDTEESPMDDMDDDFDFLAGSDETSTKLDLARAYIDMDDKDGAKDILEEVVQEGSDEQKQKAQELLEQMA